MTCVLKLFISGESPASGQAEENLRRIVAERLEGKASIEVIDILQNPDAACREGVLATPSLVRCRPLPRRKIIGDLSNPGRVVQWLHAGEASR